MQRRLGVLGDSSKCQIVPLPVEPLLYTFREQEMGISVVYLVSDPQTNSSTKLKSVISSRLAFCLSVTLNIFYHKINLNTFTTMKSIKSY